MMAQFFALTSRGLEELCADEMRKMPDVHIDSVGYRRISARTDGEVADLLQLKTADDVFLHLDTWYEIEAQRSALAKMTTRSQELQQQISACLKLIADIRLVPKRLCFSITANFVGKRNYSSDEIKVAMGNGITEAMGWQYTSEDLSDLNIRVFIDHATVWVGLRLSDSPMHARAYKLEHIEGSLKPTVAAAMLLVGNAEERATLLDPFCGAGTILIEAALAGMRAQGGDQNPAAIQAALVNSRQAGQAIGLACWDAQHLPLDRGSVDQIVTNLPWGRQVKVGENLAPFYRSVCRELERVLANHGQVVLLTNLPELVAFERFEVKKAIEISLFGQMPSILRYVG